MSIQLQRENNANISDNYNDEWPYFLESSSAAFLDKNARSPKCD